MTQKRVVCYLHGVPGSWEGMCMDFDIAVQGMTLDEVKGRLAEAICTYIEDAMKEDARTQARLLNRRAPFWLRLKLAVAMLAHVAFRHDDGEFKASIDMPCPA
jgi:hypothetical protein